MLKRAMRLEPVQGKDHRLGGCMMATVWYKTTVELRNWTDAEIATLSQINKDWQITGQILKRGND
jgi:hypothetical protein